MLLAHFSNEMTQYHLGTQVCNFLQSKESNEPHNHQGFLYSFARIIAGICKQNGEVTNLLIYQLHHQKIMKIQITANKI